MTIQELKTYKTTDGHCFEDKANATVHEAKTHLENSLRKHRLSGNYEGSYVEASVFFEYIHAHRDLISEYLNAKAWVSR